MDPATLIQIDVRWFAVLRERRGCDSEKVGVPVGTTVGALYEKLNPPGVAGRLPVLYAINHNYAAADSVLCDGDEVAFVPPLGGG
jgi:molybdopterin converting factor small subunit